MKQEKRVIKATLMTGVSDILVGLIMHFTHLHEWWFEQFHLFGVIGIGMISYALWHGYYYKKETGRKIWKCGRE